MGKHVVTKEEVDFVLQGIASTVERMRHSFMAEWEFGAVSIDSSAVDKLGKFEKNRIYFLDAFVKVLKLQVQIIYMDCDDKFILELLGSSLPLQPDAVADWWPEDVALSPLGLHVSTIVNALLETVAHLETMSYERWFASRLPADFATVLLDDGFAEAHGNDVDGGRGVWLDRIAVIMAKCSCPVSETTKAVAKALLQQNRFATIHVACTSGQFSVASLASCVYLLSVAPVSSLPPTSYLDAIWSDAPCFGKPLKELMSLSDRFANMAEAVANAPDEVQRCLAPRVEVLQSWLGHCGCHYMEHRCKQVKDKIAKIREWSFFAISSLPDISTS